MKTEAKQKLVLVPKCLNFTKNIVYFGLSVPNFRMKLAENGKKINSLYGDLMSGVTTVPKFGTKACINNELLLSIS